MWGTWAEKRAKNQSLALNLKPLRRLEQEPRMQSQLRCHMTQAESFPIIQEENAKDTK